MTPRTGGRPGLSPSGPTTRRSFRIPDALYSDASAKAVLRGEVLSEVVRRCLERYVNDTRIGGDEA